MHRVSRLTCMVVGLVCLLGGTPSWAAQSWNPTESDPYGNTAGGTDAQLTAPGEPIFSNNTAFGFKALHANYGSENTASGAGALQNNTTGYYNTASGYAALSSNSTGFENTASGYAALYSNSTGSYNTASGAGALEHSTTGQENTASGFNALWRNTTGSYNTASGAAALSSNSTGAYNTASGAGALQNNTSNHNTAIGFDALGASTGSNNLAVGTRAGANLTSGNQNIYLGHSGAAAESNTMRLGSGQTRTFIAGIAGVPVSGSAVLISSTGQVGVQVSSARYKRDIQPMGTRSQGLFQLRPVTFRYKEDEQGERQYGLIAEEVAKVYPELVTRGADGEIESVRYHEVIPILLNEVQHQQRQLAVQAHELAALQAQQARLRAAMAQQQARDAALTARLARVEAVVARTATLASR